MNDPVNHPAHYCLQNGAELIDIIEHLPYNRAAAIKYVFRAGVKEPEKEVQDLRKALWMINREIERITKAGTDGHQNITGEASGDQKIS
jgi:hypothetical protein